ncbi:MAG: EipB family protein [Candidatus Puniceispirillaceae bacterium]
MTYQKWHLAAFSYLAVLTAPSYANAIDIAPHAVTYQLGLLESDKEAGIEAIDGKTIFQIVRECEGWKSDEDYIMQMRFDGGGEIYMASLFESFEDEAGQLFSFSIDERTSYDDPLTFDGFATASGAGAEAYFSIEPDNALNLPDDTYFPIQHTFKILEMANAGETFFNGHIFFGAKPDEALKKTSVIIGNLQQAEGYDVSSDLMMTDYYPVQVAYFDPASQAGLPAYEIFFHMQKNGVVPYYQIDYGDFKLSATISDISAQDQPDC